MFDHNPGYRIVAACSPGIAPQYPVTGKITSFKDPVIFQGIDSVIGTGGVMPAGTRKQGRYKPFVKIDKK
jgi:hypothetical protein